MMQVQILGTDGNKYRCSDGVSRTAINNAEHRVNSFAWCSGDYLLGGQQYSSHAPYVPATGDGMFSVLTVDGGYAVAFDQIKQSGITLDTSPVKVSSTKDGSVFVFIDGSDVAIVYVGKDKILLSLSWINGVQTIDFAKEYEGVTILLKAGDLKKKICYLDVIGDNKQSDSDTNFIFSNSYENARCVRNSKSMLLTKDTALSIIPDDLSSTIFDNEDIYVPVTYPGELIDETIDSYYLGPYATMDTPSPPWTTTPFHSDVNNFKTQNIGLNVVVSNRYKLTFNKVGCVGFGSVVSVDYLSAATVSTTVNYGVIDTGVPTYSGRSFNSDFNFPYWGPKTPDQTVTTVTPGLVSRKYYSDNIGASELTPVIYNVYNVVIKYFDNYKKMTDFIESHSMFPLCAVVSIANNSYQTYWYDTDTLYQVFSETRYLSEIDYRITVNYKEDCVAYGKRVPTTLYYMGSRSKGERADLKATFKGNYYGKFDPKPIPDLVAFVDNHDAGNGYCVKTYIDFFQGVKTIKKIELTLNGSTLCDIPIDENFSLDVELGSDCWRWYTMSCKGKMFLIGTYRSITYELLSKNERYSLISIEGLPVSLVKIQHSVTKKEKSIVVKRKIADLIKQVVESAE